MIISYLIRRLSWLHFPLHRASYHHLNLCPFYSGCLHFSCHSYRMLRFDFKVVFAFLYFVSVSKIAPKRNCIRFHDILNQEEKKKQRLWQNVQVFRKSLQVPWPLSWQVLSWSQLETVISLALQCTHPMPRAMGIFTPLLHQSEKCSPSRLVCCSTRGRCLAEERQAALPPVDAALARTQAWQVRRRVDSSPHLPIDQGTGKRRNGAITHGHECLCLSL